MASPNYLHILTKMAEHYESLLESGLLSDVVLVAGGQQLKTHKQVLAARSPVFAAMFGHSSTKEAQENRVEITDVDVDVLKFLIKYIYTGKVEGLDRYAADLLVAADKYQVDCLKTICVQQLISQISTKSVSDLFIFADMYHATELAIKCLDYINDNRTEVEQEENWKKIRARPDLRDKLFKHSLLKYSKIFRKMASLFGGKIVLKPPRI